MEDNVPTAWPRGEACSTFISLASLHKYVLNICAKVSNEKKMLKDIILDFTGLTAHGRQPGKYSVLISRAEAKRKVRGCSSWYHNSRQQGRLVWDRAESQQGLWARPRRSSYSGVLYTGRLMGNGKI